MCVCVCVCVCVCGVGVGGGGGEGGQVCQKNTSTLLLECTKIFKSSIFISLFHTSDVRMDIHTNGKCATKGLKSHAALLRSAGAVRAKTKKRPGECFNMAALFLYSKIGN